MSQASTIYNRMNEQQNSIIYKYKNKSWCGTFYYFSKNSFGEKVISRNAGFLEEYYCSSMDSPDGCWRETNNI